jgi:F0F1-type ATP synthase membrane subunit b/b'
LPGNIVGIFKEYGPVVGIEVILIVFLIRFVWHMFQTVIKSKDAEIERLVKERDKLQDIILEKRLSTKKHNKEEK